MFVDKRSVTDNIEENTKGLPMTAAEIRYVIQPQKIGKRLLQTKYLKLIDDHRIHILVKLYNTIYSTGIITHEWLKSTFIKLRKKQFATE